MCLTLNRTYATGLKVGRKLLFPVRITLPLSDEMAKQIDSWLKDGEARLDLIREAIEREIERRRQTPD